MSFVHCDELEIEEVIEVSENDTEPADKHCSRTEFGCCPDWYTAAEGKNFLNCPEIELGWLWNILLKIG